MLLHSRSFSKPHLSSRAARVGSHQLAVAAVQRKVEFIGTRLLQLCRGRSPGKQRGISTGVGRQASHMCWMNCMCIPSH